jgi:hypothetical protein
MPGTENEILGKILIYIPCHVDYDLAFANVRMINQQLEDLSDDDRKFSIKIVVSANGVEIPSLDAWPDQVEVLTYKSDLGGDVNISLGFVKALELEPKYFWLLSANEILQSDSISNLFKLLEKYEYADMWVANAANREGKLDITNAFMNHPPKLGLGLISSVIYKYDRTKDFYKASVKFGWTGWGQLAVIHEFLSVTGDSKVIEFPYEKLFKEPFTYIGSSSLDERSIVRVNYRHSFYGLPILASNMFYGQRKMTRKFLWDWLRNNWHKINFFKLTSEEKTLYENRTFDWSHSLFQQICKHNTKTLWCIVFILEKIPLIKLQNNVLLKTLLINSKKRR